MSTPGFGLVLVAVFAAGTGLNGFYNGIADLTDAPGAIAIAVAILNIVMGITGFTTAVLVWREDRRVLFPLASWGLSAVAASVLAPLAYAPDAGLAPVILGGAITAALVAVVYAYVERRLRTTAGDERPLPS
ncbi:MAG: hypothetical protein ACT4PJ_12270 [Gemmatimonadaceae bacterium]